MAHLEELDISDISNILPLDLYDGIDIIDNVLSQSSEFNSSSSGANSSCSSEGQIGELISSVLLEDGIGNIQDSFTSTQVPSWIPNCTTEMTEQTYTNMEIVPTTTVFGGLETRPITCSTEEVVTINTSSSSSTTCVCLVCGDRAKGRYYGVDTCNACRAFFFRTLAHKRTYICQQNERCGVGPMKKQRIKCRACRYQRCLQLGMAPAKQRNETEGKQCDVKDLVQSGPVNKAAMVLKSVDDGIILRATQTLCTSYIFESYNSSQQAARNSVEIPEVDSDLNQDPLSVIASHHNALHAQIFWMVEWAKRIQGFRNLIFDDQILLLRSAARKHFGIQCLYDTARSSDSLEKLRVTWGWGKIKVTLGNTQVRDGINSVGLSELADAMLLAFESLVKPLMTAEITEEEISCFEALVLLDPNIKGLINPGKVMQIRRDLQSLIIQEKGVNPTFTWRVMDLYQLLPKMDSLSRLDATMLRDTRYFDPIGKCSKLIEDLYLDSI